MTLADFVERHARLFVLTGAGCSTDSGIPDYRDADGAWKRPQPVQYKPFLRDPATRARYWARSMVGWRHFGQAEPNGAHHRLAALERAGRVGLLVTQNVDGLHQRAGSRRVVDLHGRLDRVVCLSCGAAVRRTDWQRLLEDRNPEWAGLTARIAPDGDADLAGVDFETFDVPVCTRCGGIMKPDVVFFGESVPPWRHASAGAGLARCDAVLVVGSSLMVFSGYRYVVAAHRTGKPVAAVNLGRTRADHLIDLKVARPAAEALGDVVERLPAAAL